MFIFVTLSNQYSIIKVWVGLILPSQQLYQHFSLKVISKDLLVLVLSHFAHRILSKRTKLFGYFHLSLFEHL